jgi:hypothetical protein
MELKEFVKTSLLDVMDAVREAQQEWQDRGHQGAVNPVWTRVDKDSFRDISFDVAVTASNESAGKVGGGIRVVGIKFGGEASDSVASSSVSRIQFSVPIVPPAVAIMPDPNPSAPIEYKSAGIA